MEYRSAIQAHPNLNKPTTESTAHSETIFKGAGAETTEAPFLSIFDPGFDYESAEVAEAREANWYAQTPFGPMVLRYEQAAEVLRDRRFVRGGRQYMHKQGIVAGPLYDWFTEALHSRDGGDHTRLRGLVNHVFSRRFVEGLRPFIRSTTERLATEIADGEEECDFIAAFAKRTAGLVMCQMFGFPIEDYELFTMWLDDLGLVFNTVSERARSEAAVVGMSEYVTELIEQRRKNLGDDLLSSLITSQEAGDRLTMKELHDMVLLLLWAGQDTTTKQFGRALTAFSEHVEQWDILAARPELAEQAVEEVCRWSPQARVNFRYAAEDVTMHGLEIPADTMLLISTVAANRDPRVYENPEVFDITVPRSAPQLVFGGGVHVCIGMSVARLELAEGLVALARRFCPPTVTGEIRWPPATAMIHGPEFLPVKFTKRV
ncbi:cytochrome P450 [Nocardia sp. NPDC051900]|uniref:cytochrome P450 n=1 Tax=Nocardia sp. NPDC051900 TaxID=3364326 RepID=UPI0037BE0671